MAAEIANEWERLARDDPFWAVLTDPKRRGRLWEREADKAEFYASGEAEVGTILLRIQAAGLWEEFQRTCIDGVALDVGCGVGRATRALARRFDRIVGLDFSPSMLAAAREHALKQVRGTPWMEAGGRESTSWVRAAAQAIPFPDETFRLVYSMLVLQHQASAERILEAIAEILRVTKCDGYAAFQVPIRCHVNEDGQAPSRVSLPDGEATMLMTAADRQAVEWAIYRGGCDYVSIEPDRMTGPAFDSLTYVVRKTRAALEARRETPAAPWPELATALSGTRQS